jgi:hypothetical protein
MSPSWAAGPILVPVHQGVVDEVGVDGLEGVEEARVGGADELHQRHEQRRGVDGVHARVLDEGPAPLVPEDRHHLVVDGVADAAPFLERVRERPPVGETDAPVEGDPAHEPRVQKLLASAPDLPDAFVGELPVVTDPVDEANQVRPQLIGDGLPVLVVEVDGVHQLAVDVELELVVGAVADPDR